MGAMRVRASSSKVLMLGSLEGLRLGAVERKLDGGGVDGEIDGERTGGEDLAPVVARLLDAEEEHPWLDRQRGGDAIFVGDARAGDRRVHQGLDARGGRQRR